MEADRAAPGEACPKCGNDLVDYLEIVEDPDAPVSHVRCLRCGHFYRLKE
jgi:Zn ribbon nucleic-acid-binding protein